MYPPVVFGLVPIGVWAVWRLLGRRPWAWVVSLACLAAVGALALAQFGLILDALLPAFKRLALLPGGPPIFDQLILLLVLPVSVLLARHAFTAFGVSASVASVGGLLGMSAVAAALSGLTLVQSGSLTPPAGYYPIKLWFGVMLIC